jgi:hypothetical protein
MAAVLIALVLIVVCVGAIYYLLTSMGRDGVDAGAPGSCSSRKYGAQTWKGQEPQEHYVKIDEITRKDARSDNQTL